MIIIVPPWLGYLMVAALVITTVNEIIAGATYFRRLRRR